MTAKPQHLCKAVQAACVLLKREHDHRMNYMRLLKLLYIANRESLRRFQHPIIDDRVVAMERGPVLSEVYDLIKGTHLHAGLWSRFILLDRYEVQCVEDARRGLLSAAEIEILNEISDQFRNNDEWEMVQFTHEFAEWIAHSPRTGGCREIPLREILSAVGRADGADEIEEDIRASRAFDRLLVQVAEEIAEQ